MAIIGQGIINIGAMTGGVGSIDAATLQGHPASYFTPATVTASISGSVSLLQQQMSGVQNLTSRVVFKESFTGDGAASTFNLSGNILNGAFATGAWGSGYIILTLTAYITDLNGKVIYDSIIPFYRDKIQVVSVDSSGLVTTDFIPLAGQQGYIWYWYQLTTTDTLSYYQREDFVTYAESEVGSEKATEVWTDTNKFTNVVVKITDVSVQDALESLDWYVAGLSGSQGGFTPFAGNGITISPSGDNYIFSVSDYIGRSEVAAISGSIQSEINSFNIVAGSNIQVVEFPDNVWTISVSGDIASSTGMQGRMPCNSIDTIYTITHPQIDITSSYPIISLDVPTSGSDIFVQGIFDRNPTSFKVVLSGIPTSSHGILWHLNTTEAAINLDSANTSTFGVVIDGSGSVPLSGSLGYWNAPVNGNIISWSMIADVSGSCVVDLKKSDYNGFPNTVSIAGTEKPSLINQQKNKNDTLSSWNKSVYDGDIFEFVLESAVDCKRINIVVKWIRGG